MKEKLFTILWLVFVFSSGYCQIHRMNNSKPMKAIQAVIKKDIDRSKLRVFYFV